MHARRAAGREVGRAKEAFSLGTAWQGLQAWRRGDGRALPRAGQGIVLRANALGPALGWRSPYEDVPLSRQRARAVHRHPRTRPVRNLTGPPDRRHGHGNATLAPAQRCPQVVKSWAPSTASDCSHQRSRHADAVYRPRSASGSFEPQPKLTSLSQRTREAPLARPRGFAAEKSPCFSYRDMWSLLSRPSPGARRERRASEGPLT